MDEGLYLPEDGVGDLYGPDGELAPSPKEREQHEEEREPPTVTCAYCERDFEKVPKPQPIGGPIYVLPGNVRKLPNGLYECSDCRPVKDVETGRMVRPDPTHRE